jgi:hypothetical protein
MLWYPGEPTPPLRPGVLNGARWTNLGGCGRWQPRPQNLVFPHTKCLKSLLEKNLEFDAGW